MILGPAGRADADVDVEAPFPPPAPTLPAGRDDGPAAADGPAPGAVGATLGASLFVGFGWTTFGLDGRNPERSGVLPSLADIARERAVVIANVAVGDSLLFSKDVGKARPTRRVATSVRRPSTRPRTLHMHAAHASERKLSAATMGR